MFKLHAFFHNFQAIYCTWMTWINTQLFEIQPNITITPMCFIVIATFKKSSHCFSFAFAPPFPLFQNQSANITTQVHPIHPG